MGDSEEQRANALYENIDRTIASITPDMTPRALWTFYENFRNTYKKLPNAATLKALNHVRMLLEDQGINPDTIDPNTLQYEPTDLAAALANKPDTINHETSQDLVI